MILKAPFRTTGTLRVCPASLSGAGRRPCPPPGSWTTSYRGTCRRHRTSSAFRTGSATFMNREHGDWAVLQHAFRHPSGIGTAPRPTRRTTKGDDTSTRDLTTEVVVVIGTTAAAGSSLTHRPNNDGRNTDWWPGMAEGDAAARPAPGVDLLAIDHPGWAAVVAESVPGASLRGVSRIGGGTSAETFAVETTDGASRGQAVPASASRCGPVRVGAASLRPAGGRSGAAAARPRHRGPLVRHAGVRHDPPRRPARTSVPETSTDGSSSSRPHSSPSTPPKPPAPTARCCVRRRPSPGGRPSYAVRAR